jgi:methylated-DNA-[protein]-cysteine S-methyltransferase
MTSKLAGPLYHLAVDTPMGRIEAWATDRGLTYLHLPGPGLPDLPRDGGSCKHLDRLERALTSYFEGRGRKLDVPTDVKGTPFQERVWDEMRKIPYGETRTYGELADAVGHPRAARAVGSACSRNPVPLVVPCHRVVSGSGIGGWNGRPGMKESLLGIEGVE